MGAPSQSPALQALWVVTVSAQSISPEVKASPGTLVPVQGLIPGCLQPGHTRCHRELFAEGQPLRAPAVP